MATELHRLCTSDDPSLRVDGSLNIRFEPLPRGKEAKENLHMKVARELDRIEDEYITFHLHGLGTALLDNQTRSRVVASTNHAVGIVPSLLKTILQLWLLQQH